MLSRRICTSLRGKYSRNITWKIQQQRFLTAGDSKDPTIDYLDSLGYIDPKVQEGMKDALRGAFGKNIKVDHLKSLGPSGRFLMDEKETTLGGILYPHQFSAIYNLPGRQG